MPGPTLYIVIITCIYTNTRRIIIEYHVLYEDTELRNEASIPCMTAPNSLSWHHRIIYHESSWQHRTVYRDSIEQSIVIASNRLSWQHRTVYRDSIEQSIVTASNSLAWQHRTVYRDSIEQSIVIASNRLSWYHRTDRTVYPDIVHQTVYHDMPSISPISICLQYHLYRYAFSITYIDMPSISPISICLQYQWTIMIYLKQMAIQRIVSIFKDLWSLIKGLVHFLVTAVRSLY